MIFIKALSDQKSMRYPCFSIQTLWLPDSEQVANALETMEEIISIRHFSSQINDDIFHIIDQIKVAVVNRVCPSLIREGK